MAESPWRALSVAEAQTLEAWCECLIPEDASPGARTAGVVSFIDIQLTKRYKRHRKAYAAAIANLEKLARERHGAEFHTLTLEARTKLLQEFEKKERAFGMVLDHTLQGYLGNPRHGGNRDYASWVMMGVPPAPVRGRLQYAIENKDGRS